MDSARGFPISMLCGIVWRSTMGFHRESFRFEGGGRSNIIGLNRSGKSCRLRWVNYLHPGLKRCKMTTQEERLVIELHSKWGNRWSRIAKKLPGRTDNEIKNYWRTRMRKMAQEKRRSSSPSSSTSSSNSSLSSSNITTIEEYASFYDTGGVQTGANSPAKNMKNTNAEKDQQKDDTCAKREYSLDDIWKEINLPEMGSIKPVYSGSYVEETCKFSCPLPTPVSWESLFKWDGNEDDESKNMFLLPATPSHENQFLSCFD